MAAQVHKPGALLKLVDRTLKGYVCGKSTACAQCGGYCHREAYGGISGKDEPRC